MKKIILCIAILIGIILLFTNQVYAQNSTAQLIEGKAFYKFQPNEQWKNLTTKPVSLPTGSFVFTSAKSSAKIIFGDNSFVTLNENSLLKINTYTSTDKKENLYLKTIGRLTLEIKKILGKKTEFKIETPTALATVRGTKVRIFVQNNLYTGVAVATGDVNVRSSYLYRGTVAKNTRTFLLLNTPRGTKTINLSHKTVIADRVKTSVPEKSPASVKPEEIAPPPIEGTLNAPETIKEGDAVAVYGISTSQNIAEANLILFVGKDISNNRLGLYPRFAWMETPLAEIPKPPTMVLPKQRTMIAPGVAPIPPATAPSISIPVKPPGAPSTAPGATAEEPPTVTRPNTCTLNVVIK